MYKKFFIILLCVFLGMFTLELIATMMGNPISEMTVNDKVIKPETLPECLLYSAVTASFIGGIVNFFLTVKVIKTALKLERLPTPAVVAMTLLFPLELIVGAVFVVPNIIIFGIKAFSKKRV